MIVDDGSTDNTRELVEKFKINCDFNIIYLYKENSGKHKSINHSMSLIETELTFIVDSDDYLLPNAVENILEDWNLYKSKNIVSLQYLRGFPNLLVIGDNFKSNYEITTHSKTRSIDRVRGDKAEIWKTDLLKENPFLEFKDEKFLSEQYTYYIISGSYKILTINKIIYICEYRADGLSNKIRFLQFSNPKGSIENAILSAKETNSFYVKFKQFLLISSLSFRKGTDSIFSNLKRAEYNKSWLLLTPMSMIFYLYLYYKFLQIKINK
jgi:glycosyltransferase involved in cell wall biosynthesis